MARRRNRRRARRAVKARRRRPHEKSVLTQEEVYLNRHDEEKVLLFTTGLLLGVGVTVSILQNVFWYGWLSAVVIVLVLLFVESRQKI